MKIIKALAITPLLALLSLPAMAQHRDHANQHFQQRLERQEQRIQQGVRSGELTRHEQRRLHRQHRRLEARLRTFRRDHHLSRHERHQMNRMLRRNSRQIARLKHNDRYRPARWERRVVWNDRDDRGSRYFFYYRD